MDRAISKQYVQRSEIDLVSKQLMLIYIQECTEKKIYDIITDLYFSGRHNSNCLETTKQNNNDLSSLSDGRTKVVAWKH